MVLTKSCLDAFASHDGLNNIYYALNNVVGEGNVSRRHHDYGLGQIKFRLLTSLIYRSSSKIYYPLKIRREKLLVRCKMCHRRHRVIFPDRVAGVDRLPTQLIYPRS